MKKITCNSRIKSLLTLGNAIFLILFSFIYIRIIMNTEKIIPGGSIKYLIMFSLWSLMLAGGYIISKYFTKQKYGKIALLLLFIIQLIYVWALYSETDSDAFFINYISYNYASGNSHLLQGWGEYLSIYTNNIPATIVLTAIYHVWLPNSIIESWAFVSLIAALFSDLALYFIYKLVKSLLNEKWAFVSLLMSIFMIGLSESSTILYTDIIALWTTPAALYALIQSFRSSSVLKRIYSFLAGTALAFGAWIKIQSIIVVIAVCIVILLALMTERKNSSFRPMLIISTKFITSFIVITLVLTAISTNVINKLGAEYVERNKMPVLHFIAMGLNNENGGGYLESDVEDMKATPGQDAKNALCKEKISERLNSFGFSGIINHIDHKLIEGAGRGTFTTSLVWRGNILNHHLQARRIQNWTVITNPQFHNITAVWIQCGYLLILFFSIVSAVFGLHSRQYQKERLKYYITSICRISMIGIAIMICMLELNLRYMYAMLPGMILLSLCSMENIGKIIMPRIKKLMVSRNFSQKPSA